MSAPYTIPAQIRDYDGKASVRRHRRLDRHVPAVIYGAKQDNANIYLMKNVVDKAITLEVFHGHVIHLTINDKVHPVLLKSFQMHPNGMDVQHLDFIRVSDKDVITVDVGIRFIGEEQAPGYKQGGRFEHMMTKAHVRCLPRNLPDHIDVDVSQMQLDQTLHLSDIKLPRGIKWAIDISGDHDHALVALHKPKIQIETEESKQQDAEVDQAPVQDADNE